jgi:hypothetical protein
MALPLYFLSATRILVGASTLLLPSISGELFGIPSNAESLIIARLFGVRDLVIGAYLWTSLGNVSSSTSQTESDDAGENETLKDPPDALALDEKTKAFWLTRQVRHALWLGVICDAVDACSSIAAVLDGSMSGRAIPLVGGGAVVFTLLGVVGLRNTV